MRGSAAQSFCLQLRRLAEGLLGAVPVPLVDVVDQPQRGVRVTQVGIQFQRAQRRRLGLRERVIGLTIAEVAAQGIRVCGKRPRRGECRIQLDSLPCKLDRLEDRLGQEEARIGMPALQIKFKRARVGCLPA